MTDTEHLAAPGTAAIRPEPSRELSNLSSTDRTDYSLGGTMTLSRFETPFPGSETDEYRFNEMPELERSKDALIPAPPEYIMYKRRFFGLAQLTLLNFAIGWGYTAPSVVSTTATRWYGVSYQELNWLSIASSFVFLAPAPFTIWILNRYGVKASILIACAYTVVGNWIIYAGVATHNFPVNIIGTVIHSIASPFVLAAPTRYSRRWFNDNGRTLATAIASLAYPLGSAVGALSGPYMVKPKGPWDYDYQALVIAIVFTVAAIPAPFLPKAPPKPPSNVAAIPTLDVKASLKALSRNSTFYLQFISFSIFAGAIDTVTAVTNQAIEPYGYPQVDAGYAVAFLLFVGIGASLIVSPILDWTKAHLIALKIIVLCVAASYTVLPFIPQTRSVAALYVVYSLIGASSLSVEPCVLEFQAAWTHPVSAEFSSVISWSGAKLMTGIMTIIVGIELPLTNPQEGQPIGSLYNGLIFIAVACWVCVPCAMLTGFWKFKRPAVSKVEGND